MRRSETMVRVLPKRRIASRRKTNNTVRVRGESTDILSVKIAKFNKIAEELDIYRQMADLANHGFVITDLKGNLLYVNDSFARMHGYDARWLLGKNMKIFHDARQLKHVRAVFNRMKKTGKGLQNEELWRKRCDGTVFPTLTNNWLVRDKSGHPAIVCATMVDISGLEASKNTLKAMLNASGDLVALMDKDLKYVDMNDNMVMGLGLPREKLIGKYSLALMEPGVAALRRAKAKEVMATGKHVTFEHKSHGRIFSASCYSVTDADGKATGIVVFARDVTQREESKKTLETMLNTSGELIAMMDRNIKFVDLNERMAEPFGLPREKLIGRCAWDCMPPEAVAYRRPKAKQVLATGKPMTFLDKDEKGRVYSDSVYPVKGPNGRVAGLVVFAKDVTEQIKSQAELEAGKKTLEVMLNASGEAIAMIDRNLNFVEVNERMVQAFGIPREGLIGHCVWESMPPEAIAFRRPKAQHLLATGKPVTYFDEDKGRNYSISGYPLKASDGKVTGMVVFAKDVTEQRKSQAELEESKKTLETMLNASGELVGMFDRDMNFIDSNQQMADSMGLSREKLIGRCAWDFMPPKVAAARLAKAKQVMATGKPITFLDDGGRGRIFNTSFYPLKDLDGKVTGMVVFAKDITQSQKAEEELSHYREELFRLRRGTYLDLFSSIIMHQLSQPLTIMNVLLDDTLSEIKSGKFEKEKAIGVLEKCLRETRSAVEGIQKTRENSSRFIKSMVERFNPEQVIRDVISTLELKASKAKVKIEVTALKSLSVISGYKDALEQIVLVIAENAIEAADGGKQHRLAISVIKADNHIELVFCDDCGGIPRKNLEKIFDPFFSTKVRKGSKCLGLGLPIVRRILMVMGGEIRVKSDIGKGTTFYVHWPLS